MLRTRTYTEGYATCCRGRDEGGGGTGLGGRRGFGGGCGGGGGGDEGGLGGGGGLGSTLLEALYASCKLDLSRFAIYA